MAFNDFTGLPIPLDVLRIGGRDIGESFFGVICGIAASTHDLDEQCVRFIHCTSRIIDKLGLALLPPRQEFLAIRRIERSFTQLGAVQLAPLQLRLRTPPIAYFRDGLVIRGPKALFEPAAAASLIDGPPQGRQRATQQ